MDLYVVNKSKQISDGDAHLMVEAINQQLHNQFAPAYEVQAPSVVLAVTPPAKANVILLQDDPPKDDDGVEGYHDLSPEGAIVGFVYASPSTSNGGQILEGPNSVASVLSHEVLEALWDPWANYWVDTNGKLVIDGESYSQVALELCDPVESDVGNDILVLGKRVSLSNFILPEWSNPNFKGGPVDYLGLKRGDKNGVPFSRTKDGYVIVRNEVGDETSLFGEAYPEWKKSLKLNAKSKSRASRRLGIIA